MDERWAVFCWTAGGGLFLGGIGALFGALAGLMARVHERSPGALVGWRVLRAVERGLHRQLNPLAAGALVGAFDGAAFLGVIGILLGLAAGKTGWLPNGVLLVLLVGFAGVAALAVMIGMAAYLFTRGGIVLFGMAAVGGLAGIYLGAILAQTPGVLLGAWLGLLLGFGVGWLTQRGRPRQLPPLTKYRTEPIRTEEDSYGIQEREP